MRTRSLLALTIAGLFAAVQFAPAAHATGICTWQADPKPWLPPGQLPVEDVNTNDSSAGGVTYQERHWKVIVHAGYMYGKAWAWDDLTWIPHTGSAQVDRSGARGGFYNVISTNTCIPNPPHTTTASAACTFDTAVSTNSPGYAEASGMTHLMGSLTGLDITATAGCQCGIDQPEHSITVTYTYSAKDGSTVQVPITLQWGQDTKTDAATATQTKTAQCLDEEYSMDHKLHVRATGDSSVWNWTGSGLAKLKNHYLYIHTISTCSLCQGHIDVTCIVNAASEGVTED